MRSCLLVIVCFLFVASAKADRPSIILVMADDQGWGDTGYNGHPVVQTPHLDLMAKDAMVFHRFYAAAPVCSPTRGSVLTGRHPFRMKITNHGRYMRPQEVTIAEELKHAGYVTGMFGKWHVGSAQAESPVCPGNSGFDEWCIGLNFFDNDPYLSRNGKIEQIQGKGTEITVNEAISFLRKHKDGDKPLFAVVWFPSPHDPHQEKPDPERLYEGEKQAGYWGEISLFDSALGRLRLELRELEMADNTILWYCSDNGGLDSATSGGRARKGSVYEGGLRVPSLLEWPARIEPGSTEVPGNTSDMLPTLLSLAGVSRSGTLELDGVDLSNVISGQESSRPAMGFWHGFQNGQSTRSDRILKEIMQAQESGQPTPYPERLKKDIEEFPQYSTETLPGHAALIVWPWKIHRIEKAKEEDNNIRYELYNLSSDPMENENLSSQDKHRERLVRMKEQLNRWQVSVIESLNGKDYDQNDSK